MKHVLCALFLIVLCSPSPLLHGQSRPAILNVIADTDTRVLTSREGRQYQITVAVPRTYHEASQSYPVLYVLDANGLIGTAVEATRNLTLEGLIPEVVVVGIGYPVGHYWYTRPQRTLDYTPTMDSAWLARSREPEIAAGSARPLAEATGGAPEFYGFITEELIPFIEDGYRVRRDGRALLGHSFGGLFALYALFRTERVFDRFLVSSPSIWWDGRVALELEDAFSRTRRQLAARLFLSVGDSEPEGDGPEAPRMVSNVKDLDVSLRDRQYQGLELTTTIFEGETHVSVIPAAISRGLRWLYGSARQ